MKQPPGPDLEVVGESSERRRVHEWRVERLRRLGLRYWEAELSADRVDWHAFADLVTRGCPPALALQILR